MDARFIFVPVAALVVAHPSQATVFMSEQQAQALMFPGATFTQDFKTLSKAQVKAIESASDTNVLNPEVKIWKVSTGGWFISDQVVGKHDFIPFALGIDEHGSVKGIEILEYREAYGGEVTNAKWRAQFTGKNPQSPLKLTNDIKNISGATLSSKHITDGVRRLLATHAVLSADR
jgi:Na+-translocating ferredoxin:NAD+ oxidoreductase RnfG subunit